jgi:putative glutamine amidotransferase
MGAEVVPTVGIVCKSAENDLVRAGDPDGRVARAYRLALEAVGLSVKLLPTNLAPHEQQELFECHGYLLAGGASDVSIGYAQKFPEAPHEPAELDVERDLTERKVVLHARAGGKPLLGICRGMQLLNVVLGGQLFPLVGERRSLHRSLNTPFDRAIHSARVSACSRLRKVLGASPIPVNSAHGVAVYRTGGETRVCARSEDGVVEAIEVPEDTWTIGVQWHPEALLEDPRQLALFVDFAGYVRKGGLGG